MSARGLGTLRVCRWTFVALLAAAAPAAAQTANPRFFVTVNGGMHSAPDEVTQTGTMRVNQEDADITMKSTMKASGLVDVGGGMRLTDKLWVQVAFTTFAKKSSAEVTAHVPHPLLFSQLRTIEGDIAGVNHKETAVHIDVMWPLQVISGLDVNVFGGPTFFSIGQDLASTVTYTETYPFDTATFSGAPTTRVSKSAVGFNVGADITKYLTPRLGVGGILRFSGATADMDSPLGGQVSVKAGGFEAGGGVRIRF